MATETQNIPKEKDDAGTGAHWPIERQMTSAEMAEEDALTGEGPVLAPQPYKTADDPNLDPNVRRGGPASTAGPARTETTRDAALAANLVVEAQPGDPATSTNSQAGRLGEDAALRDERIREENAKKASAPNTVSNPSLQDEDGKTKPAVVKAMEADQKKADDADKAAAKAEADSKK